MTDNRAKYNLLMAESDEQYTQANRAALKRCSFPQFEHHIQTAWELARLAMEYFDKLPASEQQEIREAAMVGMAEGFVRGLASFKKSA